MTTVLLPAGTVTVVARGVTDAVEVAGAVEIAGAVDEDAPITVTRTSTVYGRPVVADVTVKITGIVNPIKLTGGSKVIKPLVTEDIRAQVALLVVITSAGLFRNDSMLRTVSIPAGTVIAVARAGEEVEIAGAAEVEEGAITVIRTSTVYGMPEVAERTVKMTGTVSPLNDVGGLIVIWPGIVEEIVAQVALLRSMISDGSFRSDSMLRTVLIPAGTVMPVARGGVEEADVRAGTVEVGAAVMEEVDWPTTVTSTSMV